MLSVMINSLYLRCVFCAMIPYAQAGMCCTMCFCLLTCLHVQAQGVELMACGCSAARTCCHSKR